MTDQLMQDVYRKIEREKTLIKGARQMKGSTDNSAVRERLDSQIRESERNLGYLTEKYRELEGRAEQSRLGNAGGWFITITSMAIQLTVSKVDMVVRWHHPKSRSPKNPDTANLGNGPNIQNWVNALDSPNEP